MVRASRPSVSIFIIIPAIAKRFAQEGAHVVLSSRKRENVDEAVASLKREARDLLYPCKNYHFVISNFCLRIQGLNVVGKVCHVGDETQRHALVEETLKQFGM